MEQDGPNRLRLSGPSALGTLALLLLLVSGCAGYRFGNASLYPPDVHTVYVPVFESDSYRRGLGERLTEAVIKQIELKTPYKVVQSSDADSVLIGKIMSDSKRVIVQDTNGQPRESEVGIICQVAWTNRKGDLVAGANGKIPIPEDALTLTSTGKLLPEYGQSTVTAQQQAIDRLAIKIVAMMESPW